MDEPSAQILRDNIDRQTQAVASGNAEDFYGLDNAFHSEIAKLSGNPGVWNIILQANTQFDRVRHLSVHEPGRNAKLLVQHKEIADALIGGDVTKAKSAVRRHLREVFTTVEKLGLTENTTSAPPRRKRVAPEVPVS